MLIPRITNIATLQSAGLASALGRLPVRLYTNSSDAIVDIESSTSIGNTWVQTSQLGSVDELIALFDQGIEGVIVSDDVYQQLAASESEQLGRIPQARLGVYFGLLSDQKTEQFLVNVITRVAMVVLPSGVAESNRAALVSAVAQAEKAGYLPEVGGARRVVVDLWENASVEAISGYAQAGCSVIVPAEALSLDSQRGISVGSAFVAANGLHSDRPDGLFVTVVCDERNECLGVVYSNQESILEALKTGEGVYWSRKKGLWRKGLTSGATQTLHRVDVDCDSDALRFTVKQHGTGFCHVETRGCFGSRHGLGGLDRLLRARKERAPEGSYTRRLFDDADLLKSKIMEEAEELCQAKTKEEVAWEAADLLYFALAKCAASEVSLADIEANLDRKHRKLTRRPGNAKAREVTATTSTTLRTSITADSIRPAQEGETIRMRKFTAQDLSQAELDALLQRPIIDSSEIMARVAPIVGAVRARGDPAIREFTAKFDGIQLEDVVLRAPFPTADLPDATRTAIDQAYENVKRFHEAQLSGTLNVETMPGVVCSRFSRPIERVGLYVPGGTAVLPSTALMLGVPAQVAGCREIVLATPPRKDGSVVPEVLYTATKVGATAIVLAGGAQAVAAMAYGTESVPKVDKICGPGNQYVTAAKMLAQNDTAAMVSIDMPAGPSEVLVIADATSNPAYVASDLLSQAEHGPDSQVVLLAVALTDTQLEAIEEEVHTQALRLPRVDIVRHSIPKSFCLRVDTLEEAFAFSNAYAPEHLILQLDDAEAHLDKVNNAGSVFVGHYSPESCGDYASGTNHTLPTYGFARMYSGVNTGTFLKHITAQQLTRDGLRQLGPTVMTLAEVEELEAHRNAVAIRLRDDK